MTSRARSRCREDVRGGGLLGGQDDVLQEHRPGHRAHPAGVGGDVARDLDDVQGDVPGDLAVDPADADVEDGGARLDDVLRDQTGDAGGGDHDVGGAQVRGQVAGAGVA